jgi:hypothetical protein
MNEHTPTEKAVTTAGRNFGSARRPGVPRHAPVSYPVG